MLSSSVDGDGADAVRLIIVDGDRRVRHALIALLNAATHLVVAGEAGAPEAALGLVRRTRPDTAVVDLHLPTVTAACELIRQLTETYRVRVVALSTQEALRGAATAAGASMFVLKASTPDEVVAAVVALQASARPRVGG